MFKNKKFLFSKISSTLLVITILVFTLFSFVRIDVKADAIKPEGAEWLVNENDDHVWYSLTESDTVLSIGGVGRMPDFTKLNEIPWYSSRSKITSLNIEEGITYIGQLSFVLNITSVVIPKTVEEMGARAFYQCRSLKEVTILAVTPPTFGVGALDFAMNAVIKVPGTSYGAYKQNENWGGSPYKLAQAGGTLTVNGETSLDGKMFLTSGEAPSGCTKLSSKPAAGATITIEATPDEGYNLSMLSAIFEYNYAYTGIKINRDATNPNKFTFNMPNTNGTDKDVVIYWLFEKDGKLPFDSNHKKITDSQIGIGDWVWNANYSDSFKEMIEYSFNDTDNEVVRNYNGIQLDLAPYLEELDPNQLYESGLVSVEKKKDTAYFDRINMILGGKNPDEAWDYIKQQQADGSINLLATRLTFPGVNYDTQASYAKTNGYFYGVEYRTYPRAYKNSTGVYLDRYNYTEKILGDELGYGLDTYQLVKDII